MEYITDFDKLFKELDNKPVSPDKLVSKQPSVAAITLFDYLKSIYGKKILSGQQYLQEEELEAGRWFSRDHLPTIPEKLSIARRLIDDWLAGS